MEFLNCIIDWHGVYELQMTPFLDLRGYILTWMKENLPFKGLDLAI